MANSTQSTARPPQESHGLLRKYLPPFIIALSVALLVYACSIASTGDPSGLADSFAEVERVFPLPESEVLRQSLVGVDLAPGFGADLYINGTRIPEDQINVQGNPDFDGAEPEQFDQFEVISRYQYQPLAGRVIEALNGDTNCVRAEIFQLEDEQVVRSIDWCFTAA